VLVLAEQLQGLGGLGEYADGFGAADIDGVLIALESQDVGDPVDGGFEPDDITGGGAGNDQLQTMLAAAAEPDEPFLRSGGCLLLRADRVGVDDLGFQQGFATGPMTRLLVRGRAGHRPSRLVRR